MRLDQRPTSLGVALDVLGRNLMNLGTVRDELWDGADEPWDGAR
jgi:hypothetical protein